jgi:hypothetical protein
MILNLSNSSNCSLINITFFAANINLKNSRNCLIKNCNFIYPTPFFTFRQGFEKFSPIGTNGYEDPENWNGNGPDWSKYEGPETWNGNGIEISGENNTIENCYIAHSWGDGLTVWGKGNRIKNNIITDCNWMGIECAPLNISGSEHLIQNNELSYGGRSILIHRYLSNSKILNNHIHHGGILCNDQGLTYSFWTDGKGTEIAYNYLHDNLGEKNQCGIYLDNWTYNFNIHHNIINNTGTGININKPHNNHLIFNNTLYNNTYSMGSWGPEGTELKNVHTFNNITDSDKRERWNYKDFYGTKLETNYKYNEPIFQDPINHNFQLKKFSYPIDKGTSNEYTISFEGKAPDLGALESGKIPFTYGASIIVPNEKYYPPRAPIKLKLIANTPDTTLFKWEYPFGECDTFYIERKISTDTFKIIQRLAANKLEFNDSMQPPGEYRYQIRAKNQYGISEPSNSIEIFNPKYKNSFFLDAENNDLKTGTVITGDYISNADEADWIAYKQINFSENKYDACIVNMAVPCEQAWQEVQVRIDRPMGRMIGNFRTTSTGAWDKFEQRTFPIEPITGYHDVYIKFKGEAGIGSFDWFNLYNSNGTVRKTYPQATNNCPQERNTSRQIPITIYPNPSNEEVAVAIENIETSTITIKFASLNGVLWLNKTYTNQLPGTQEYYLHNEINIPQLEKGMYIIEITVAGKRVTQTKNYKFIKN